MCWVSRLGFRMGVVSIDAFQVCLKSLPNFHAENPIAFHLIFVTEIRQHFTSNVSQHAKCYSHQAFDMRMRQWGCFIFTAKIQQSFTFSAPARFHDCVYGVYRHAHTVASQIPLKCQNMLIHVAYTGKPMSLGDMDHDNHTAMIVHTIQHEYALTTIALSTYPYYKVKSSHNQKWSLTQPRRFIIQSAQSSTHT